MEAGLTRQQVIALLTRSPHGELAQYIPTARIAARIAKLERALGRA